MGIPSAAAKLFDTLSTARGGCPTDLDDARRRTWVTDLVIALSAFPSLPPRAARYRGAELNKLLPKVDQLEARPGINIQQTLSKIERVFTKGQRVLSIPSIVSGH
jgi:hypothetical protein